MITAGKEGIYLDLQVQPKARNPGVRGVHGDRLKLGVAQPAVGGKANEAVLLAVAGLLEVPKNAVSLATGKTSRMKRVHVAGITPAEAQRLIGLALSRDRRSG